MKPRTGTRYPRAEGWIQNEIDRSPEPRSTRARVGMTDGPSFLFLVLSFVVPFLFSIDHFQGGKRRGEVPSSWPRLEILLYRVSSRLE